MERGYAAEQGYGGDTLGQLAPSALGGPVMATGSFVPPVTYAAAPSYVAAPVPYAAPPTYAAAPVTYAAAPTYEAAPVTAAAPM